jgi:hypothetical protein
VTLKHQKCILTAGEARSKDHGVTGLSSYEESFFAGLASHLASTLGISWPANSSAHSLPIITWLSHPVSIFLMRASHYCYSSTAAPLMQIPYFQTNDITRFWTNKNFDTRESTHWL